MRPRIAVTLLIEDGYLVKTERFRRPKYIGDPINAVRILNDKEIDELVVLDKTAAAAGGPNLELVADIASEAFMPVSYGGGISTIANARSIFGSGVEKVVINQAAIARPELIREIADESGSQSVTLSLDIERSRRGALTLVGPGGRTLKSDPIAWAKECERLGAGELFITAVHREGTMKGMDEDLVAQFCQAVSIPVVAHGGAASLSDLRGAIIAGASAAAAGSMFVYRDASRAVLINYPPHIDVTNLLENLTNDG